MDVSVLETVRDRLVQNICFPMTHTTECLLPDNSINLKFVCLPMQNKAKQHKQGVEKKYIKIPLKSKSFAVN